MRTSRHRPPTHCVHVGEGQIAADRQRVDACENIFFLLLFLLLKKETEENAKVTTQCTGNSKRNSSSHPLQIHEVASPLDIVHNPGMEAQRRLLLFLKAVESPPRHPFNKPVSLIFLKQSHSLIYWEIMERSSPEQSSQSACSPALCQRCWGRGRGGLAWVW